MAILWNTVQPVHIGWSGKPATVTIGSGKSKPDVVDIGGTTKSATTPSPQIKITDPIPRLATPANTDWEMYESSSKISEMAAKIVHNASVGTRKAIIDSLPKVDYGISLEIFDSYEEQEKDYNKELRTIDDLANNLRTAIKGSNIKDLSAEVKASWLDVVTEASEEKPKQAVVQVSKELVEPTSSWVTKALPSGTSGSQNVVSVTKTVKDVNDRIEEFFTGKRTTQLIEDDSTAEDRNNERQVFNITPDVVGNVAVQAIEAAKEAYGLGLANTSEVIKALDPVALAGKLSTMNVNEIKDYALGVGISYNLDELDLLPNVTKAATLGSLVEEMTKRENKGNSVVMWDTYKDTIDNMLLAQSGLTATMDATTRQAVLDDLIERGNLHWETLSSLAGKPYQTDWETSVPVTVMSIYNDPTIPNPKDIFYDLADNKEGATKTMGYEYQHILRQSEYEMINKAGMTPVVTEQWDNISELYPGMASYGIINGLNPKDVLEWATVYTEIAATGGSQTAEQMAYGKDVPAELSQYVNLNVYKYDENLPLMAKLDNLAMQAGIPISANDNAFVKGGIQQNTTAYNKMKERANDDRYNSILESTFADKSKYDRLIGFVTDKGIDKYIGPALAAGGAVIGILTGNPQVAAQALLIAPFTITEIPQLENTQFWANRERLAATGIDIETVSDDYTDFTYSISQLKRDMDSATDDGNFVVAERKRAEYQDMLQWFGVWLEENAALLSTYDDFAPIYKSVAREYGVAQNTTPKFWKDVTGQGEIALDGLEYSDTLSIDGIPIKNPEDRTIQLPPGEYALSWRVHKDGETYYTTGNVVVENDGYTIIDRDTWLKENLSEKRQESLFEGAPARETEFKVTMSDDYDHVLIDGKKYHDGDTFKKATNHVAMEYVRKDGETELDEFYNIDNPKNVTLVSPKVYKSGSGGTSGYVITSPVHHWGDLETLGLPEDANLASIKFVGMEDIQARIAAGAWIKIDGELWNGDKDLLTIAKGSTVSVETGGEGLETSTQRVTCYNNGMTTYSPVFEPAFSPYVANDPNKGKPVTLNLDWVDIPADATVKVGSQEIPYGTTKVELEGKQQTLITVYSPGKDTKSYQVYGEEGDIVNLDITTGEENWYNANKAQSAKWESEHPFQLDMQWLDDPDVKVRIGDVYLDKSQEQLLWYGNVNATVVVEKEGYEDKKYNIYGSPGEKQTLTLEPGDMTWSEQQRLQKLQQQDAKPWTINLKQPPDEDVTIWMNGYELPRSLTKLESQIKTDTTIVVTKPGYDDKKYRVIIEPGEEMNLVLEPGDKTWVPYQAPEKESKSYGGGGGGGGGGSYTPRTSVKEKSIGYVVFGSVCANAAVFWDGEQIDPDIEHEYQAVPGYHACVVYRDGYQTWRKTVYIIADQTLNINPDLIPVEIVGEEGEENNENVVIIDDNNEEENNNEEEEQEGPKFDVFIDSEPRGAKILIDNCFTGAWVPDSVTLYGGLYLLTLYKTGYEAWETWIWVDETTLYGEEAIDKAVLEGVW